MEEIIKFIEKVLEAVRTDNKFKGEFKGYKVIVSYYNDKFAFYVDNHVVRDIPCPDMLEMYLKTSLSEIVLGKKVMDANPITTWLHDNKIPFIQNIHDSKSRTLILYPSTDQEAWLNLSRTDDSWKCIGQSTNLMPILDSSGILSVIKSYVYSVNNK